MDWVVLIISYLFSYDLICAVRFGSDGHRGEGTGAHLRARFPASGALVVDGGGAPMVLEVDGEVYEVQGFMEKTTAWSACSIGSWREEGKRPEELWRR
jgi:hypothetical protein